jgi:hypothetical protein
MRVCACHFHGGDGFENLKNKSPLACQIQHHSLSALCCCLEEFVLSFDNRMPNL